MKNQSAPCQGVKCPKGYKLNGNCTCTKVSDDSKVVKGAVKEISKEEYNKIRGFKNGGTMKKKMQSGGTSEGYPGSGLSKIASKMTPKPGAGYKSGIKGNEGIKSRPATKGYDAYKRDAIERAGGEDNARQAGYIKQKGGTMKKMKTGGMVNPNASLQASKTAGSKGVKSGVNPKAVAAKKATGKSSGGVDTPPSKAIPSAKYGRMMKKGGMVKAKKK